MESLSKLRTTRYCSTRPVFCYNLQKIPNDKLIISFYDDQFRFTLFYQRNETYEVLLQLWNLTMETLLKQAESLVCVQYSTPKTLFSLLIYFIHVIQSENTEENFNNLQTITNNQKIIHDERTEKCSVQPNGTNVSSSQSTSQSNSSDSIGRDKDKTTTFTFKDISFQQNNKRYQKIFRLPEQEILKQSTYSQMNRVLKLFTSQRRNPYLHSIHFYNFLFV